MSFYGSVYYQIANAFARIVIENASSTKIDFPKEDLINEVTLDATSRLGSVQLQAGNRWIQFTTDALNNVCMIWHGAPDANATTLAPPIVKIEDPSEPIINGATELEAGSVFQVPLLRYDTAGHLIPTKEVQNFILPKTDFESDLDVIKADIESLNEFTEDLAEIGANHDEKIKMIESQLTGLFGKDAELESKIDEVRNETASNKGRIDNYDLQISALDTRLQALEQQLGN